MYLKKIIMGLRKMKRIYHKWDKWECYKAGFHDNKCRNGETDDEAQTLYKNLLSDVEGFEEALKKVLKEWPNSCEHNLSNESMNRVAWLGQAALAYKYNIPCRFRTGYRLLSDEQKVSADKVALKYLNIWLENKGEKSTDMLGAGVNCSANQY